ncbi:MAG: amidohydrolase family protein [Verrucomicrobiales bacterium]|nr:amidohydrolase family protein [Verrucomicrobiales bacterium]
MSPNSPRRRPLIDAHVHLVDFLQGSDGLRALLGRMDDAGVEKAVAFGMPVIKKWNAFDPVEPRYYLDDNARCYYYSYTDQLVASAWESLDPMERSRFALLACGFNPTDRHAVRHLERVVGDRECWRGVGEVLLRHDDLTNLTLEETARANHPALQPVYGFCADRGLPILLHQNSTSVGRHDQYVYLHELEEVLDRHRELTVVWGHCGFSRRVGHDRYHEMMDRMLRTHSRLHADLSWVGFDEVICPGGVADPNWLELVRNHPDRFLLGSDLVGHFTELGPTLRRFDPFLEALGDPVADGVARGNALRLFFPEIAPSH